MFSERQKLLLQRRLTWSLGALFSFVSLLGHGLHLLHKDGHACAHHGAATCRADSAAIPHLESAHPDHNHSEVGAHRLGHHHSDVARGHANHGPSTAIAATALGHDRDTCAVCHFFSQSQQAPTLTATPSATRIPQATCVAMPVLTLKRRHTPHGPRAPPIESGSLPS